MTCRNTFLFIPRNGILCPPFFGIYLFHPFDIAKNEPFLGGFAPPATWANHRSVFNGIRFYSCQNIVSTKTQQGMFRVTRNLLGYSQKNCLSVICSSVVGQLRWKEHIKKHKKFLIFLIDNLDFIFLCKIRNNDRTIEYII